MRMQSGRNWKRKFASCARLCSAPRRTETGRDGDQAQQQEVRSSYEAELVQLRNTVQSMRGAIELAAVEAEREANAVIHLPGKRIKQLTRHDPEHA